MTLGFRECRVFGKGEDRDGPFSIVGEYDPQYDEVRMLKSYPNLRVWYSGIWNGRFLAGESTIECWPYVDYGTFELWPESEQVSLAELALEATTTK